VRRELERYADFAAAVEQIVEVNERICEAGLEAAETVIRSGMLQLGGSITGKLLAADPGYRGPRVDCGRGHLAAFAGYRDKVIDTVLGPVTISRAWYNCTGCGPRAGAP
jgi:hypothetical protein